MRRALKLFRRITGLTAVTSVATSFPEPGTSFTLFPPMHPRCARKLRSVRNPPCAEQWIIHLRTGRRSPRTHSHTCPIGMRCSCVPIHFGDQLVGIAKLVLDAGTPEPVVRTALSILKLVVSGTCQESAASLLTEEVRALRQRVADLQRVRWRGNPGAGRSVASSTAAGAERKDAQGASLVERAVIHLQREYLDPTLTLQSVAKALGCNPRYLTTRFTRIVGERMHTYVITLRVSNACRLLTGTDLLVKEVAYASGFARTGRLTSAFRRHVGVSPSEYRRIFSGS